MAVSTKPDDTNEFGARRRHAGVSQQRLAALAGCSISAVRLFEHGYTPSPSPTRDRVVRVLDELESGNGQPPASGVADAGRGTAGSFDVIGDQGAIDRLPSEQRLAQDPHHRHRRRGQP